MGWVGPTHEREQIDERIGPPVLFGEPVPERADETGTPERTLRRRIAALRDGGLGSLYDASLSRGAKLEAVTNPRLFADRYGMAQTRRAA